MEMKEMKSIRISFQGELSVECQQLFCCLTPLTLLVHSLPLYSEGIQVSFTLVHSKHHTSYMVFLIAFSFSFSM